MAVRFTIATTLRRLGGPRRLVPLAAAALAAQMAFAGGSAAAEELTAEVAPHLELNTPIDSAVALRAHGPVEKVVVSQPDVASVGVAGPEDLYVMGHELGATNLLVFGRDGRLTQTISVRVGYDAEALGEALAAALPDEAIQVTALSSTLMLSGEVSSASAARTAEALAERAAPGAVISRLHARSSQVRLDVRIVEASSRRLRDLGAALSVSDGAHVAASVGGGLLGTARPHTSAAIHRDAGRYAVDAALQALEAKGHARIVAQPSLVALSGTKASFRSGGELPYPVPQSDGKVAVEFRAYGAALAFSPEVQANGLIRIALDAELSGPDFAASVTILGEEVPSLSVRRAETSVELPDGQSLVIAGLFETSRERRAERTPLVSKTPLAGPLFQSRRAQDNRRELAIIVTPTLVRDDTVTLGSPSAPAALDRPLERPQGDPPKPEPKTGAGPRGPPLKALARELGDVLRPPLRWIKRQALGLASALAGDGRKEYASTAEV